MREYMADVLECAGLYLEAQELEDSATSDERVWEIMRQYQYLLDDEN